MQLPIDVAFEVALMTKQISKDTSVEKDINTQTIALCIIKAKLLADTIRWKNWMVGV